jgi:hypothetical protein
MVAHPMQKHDFPTQQEVLKKQKLEQETKKQHADMQDVKISQEYAQEHLAQLNEQCRKALHTGNVLQANKLIDQGADKILAFNSAREIILSSYNAISIQNNCTHFVACLMKKMNEQEIASIHQTYKDQLLKYCLARNEPIEHCHIWIDLGAKPDNALQQLMQENAECLRASTVSKLLALKANPNIPDLFNITVSWNIPGNVPEIILQHPATQLTPDGDSQGMLLSAVKHTNVRLIKLLLFLGIQPVVGVPNTAEQEFAYNAIDQNFNDDPEEQETAEQIKKMFVAASHNDYSFLSEKEKDEFRPVALKRAAQNNNIFYYLRNTKFIRQYDKK